MLEATRIAPLSWRSNEGWRGKQRERERERERESMNQCLSRISCAVVALVSPLELLGFRAGAL